MSPRSRISLPLWLLLLVNIFIVVDYVSQRVLDFGSHSPLEVFMTTPERDVSQAVEDSRVVIPIAPVSLLPQLPKRPQECNHCDIPGSPCARYGEHNLARSRGYEGSNARLRRVIQKAQSGQPVTIGVLGGSVTAGHGVTPEENWTWQLFHWWSKTFPHPDNVFINGAVPAVTSEYYSSCFLEHIPEDADLIILEIAINDGRNDFYAETYEWLVRMMLNLPSKPAVVNAQTLGLVFQSISTGGDLHLGFATYYDLPTISLRNVILESILEDQELEKAYFVTNYDGSIDLRHLNTRGHRMLADLLIAYLQRQICAIAEAKSILLDEGDEGQQSMDEHPDKKYIPRPPSSDAIPRLRLLEQYVHDKIAPDIHPQCLSTRSRKHPLIPSESSGWSEWSWKDKTYLVAKEPGAQITFDITLQPEALGLVRLSYLRSATFGLGNLGCWIDDNKSTLTILRGYWEYENLNLVQEGGINTSPSPKPGAHKLHCEVLEATSDPGGGREVRLVALATL